MVEANFTASFNEGFVWAVSKKGKPTAIKKGIMFIFIAANLTVIAILSFKKAKMFFIRLKKGGFVREMLLLKGKYDKKTQTWL
jgi:hypothetical protein